MVNFLIRLLQAIPDRWLLRIAFIFIGLVTVYFVGERIWILIIYLPMQIFFELIETNPSFTAQIIAKRTRFAVIIIITVFFAGIFLYLLHIGKVIEMPLTSDRLVQHHLSSDSANRLIYGFLLLGVVLGALLRHITGRIVYRVLLSRSRTGIKILGLATWSAVIVIAPYQIHPYAVAYFLVGLAIGMTVHKWFHYSIEKRSQARRRLLNIYTALRLNEVVEVAVVKAVELLIKDTLSVSRKYRKLRNLLNEYRRSGNLSKELALISASLLRFQGKFRDSIAEIDAATSDGFIDENTHLLVMKAINLADQNNNADANELLDKILGLQRGMTCKLTNSTKALWLAEELLQNLREPALSAEPLKYALKAIELKMGVASPDERLTKFLSRFFDFGAPVGATFVLDVWGYSLLSAGSIYEARIVFEHCIEIDPSYSSAYLHLGDYFVLNSGLRSDPSRKLRDLWHAEVCYRTALISEHEMTTRIASRASMRLDQLTDYRKVV
ncbi:MAG: hypothetical protein ABIK83_15990 [Candidatus Zixiibacteriota bacterium]